MRLDRRRRGVAMLLVLALLVVMVSAATIAARSKTTASFSRSASADAELCEDVLRASAEATLDWLANRSSGAVIHPESDEPRVSVLHDRWPQRGRVCEVRITAWDQCGMIPISAVVLNHPLGGLLPQEVRGVCREAIAEGESAPHGLDQLDIGPRAVFPTHARSDPTLLGDCPAVSKGRDTPSSTQSLAIGAVVATHNPPKRMRVHGTGAPLVWLNVNTAPIDLFEEGARLAGFKGVDALVDARAEGRPADLRLLVSAEEADPSAPIRFVGSSPSWGVRTDVRVGAVTRSVWTVWVKTSSSWEPVQRLAIDE